jgi:hypothetical protein
MVRCQRKSPIELLLSPRDPTAGPMLGRAPSSRVGMAAALLVEAEGMGQAAA